MRTCDSDGCGITHNVVAVDVGYLCIDRLRRQASTGTSLEYICTCVLRPLISSTCARREWRRVHAHLVMVNLCGIMSRRLCVVFSARKTFLRAANALDCVDSAATRWSTTTIV